MTSRSSQRAPVFNVNHFLLNPLWIKYKRKYAKTFRRMRLKTSTIDFYVHPNDPYNLLFIPMLEELCQRYRVKMNPIIIDSPPNTPNPFKHKTFSYALRDVKHLAKTLKIKLPEPLVSEISSQQTWLATRILLRNQTAKTALNILDVVSEALWTGHKRRLKQYALWHHSVTREEAQEQVVKNFKQLEKQGHRCSGMLYFDGEWYNSHKSIHHLEARLIQERSTPSSHRMWVYPPRLQIKQNIILSDVTVQFYFSFSDPYSFIALNQLLKLSDHYRFKTEFKPLKLPQENWEYKFNQHEGYYYLHEAHRDAELYGTQFGRYQNIKPQHENLMLALFAQAEAQGQARQWSVLALNAIWREGINCDDSQALYKLLERSSLHTDALNSALDTRPWESISNNNAESLSKLNLWDTPSIGCESFATQGHDRLWLLERYLLGQLDVP